MTLKEQINFLISYMQELDEETETTVKSVQRRQLA